MSIWSSHVITGLPGMCSYTASSYAPPTLPGVGVASAGGTAGRGWCGVGTVGPDGLCFFSGLLFYSFILRSFTYYSFLQQYYSTYYINVRKPYNTEQYTVIDTTVSRFTRDALISIHDAYMTVELYNNYYICVILHARSRMLQVLLFINALKECSEYNNCIIIDYVIIYIPGPIILF